MRRPTRALVAVAAASFVTTLAACESNSFSSSCSGQECSVAIEGDAWNDFPLPYSKDGTSRDKTTITLVSAAPGGEAVIETNGVENRCTQGASFVVADTTITCDVVGDRKVELSSVRR
ncbi:MULTISPECIES: hypothetical protein [Janibacter]|uniref:hypothetical protein n=1 Tax=Janibacter TaxID=53457 RepID=UPI000838BF05|nr:hypothetical protein [Janibacter terrae]MBA4085095.1 hypothetical protein [Kytococcus sp.]HCE60965.1 hypothetical protein [Janibacter terrae]